MNEIEKIEEEIKVFKKIHDHSKARVEELEKKRKELLKNERPSSNN